MNGASSVTSRSYRDLRHSVSRICDRRGTIRTRLSFASNAILDNAAAIYRRI